MQAYQDGAHDDDDDDEDEDFEGDDDDDEEEDDGDMDGMQARAHLGCRAVAGDLAHYGSSVRACPGFHSDKGYDGEDGNDMDGMQGHVHMLLCCA